MKFPVTKNLLETRSSQRNDLLLQSSRDQSCPRIDIQIDTEQVDAARRACLAHEHCFLPRLVQICRPHIEHGNVYELGDVMFEFGGRLSIAGTKDERRRLATVVRHDR